MSPTVEPEDSGTEMFGYLVSELQEDVTVKGSSIRGTLKYINSGSLADYWGPGYFLALKFSDIDPALETVKVGLTPSQGSGLLPLDEDLNGSFKITDKNTQRVTVEYTDGETTKTDYYRLTGLVMEEPDLDNMTKTQLLEYAEVIGISGVSSSMTKSEIIAVIEAE